jgi:hypothetical protein
MDGGVSLNPPLASGRRISAGQRRAAGGESAFRLGRWRCSGAGEAAGTADAQVKLEALYPAPGHLKVLKPDESEQMPKESYQLATRTGRPETGSS